MKEKIPPKVASCLAMMSLFYMSKTINIDDIEKVRCFGDTDINYLWKEADKIWDSYKNFNDIVSLMANSLDTEQRFTTFFNLWEIATGGGKEGKDIDEDVKSILGYYLNHFNIPSEATNSLWAIETKNLEI